MQEPSAKKRFYKNVLRDTFLFEYSLTYNDILFEHRERSDQSRSKSQLFCGDAKGNMKIYYPSLDGYLEQSNKKGSMLDTYRTRLANPFIKDGEPVKYIMDGHNVIFYPPQLIAAFKAGTEIETLIVTEGEKKAFVAAKNGFDCVGISGIWNFCSKANLEEGKQDELMPSLKEFIKKCSVKNVVLLHDSDALDISKNTNKSATDRVFNFYQSTKRFAELIFQEGVKFYYSYINPHINGKAEKLGLDDLIKQYEDYNQTVLLDFHTGVKENKFTSYFNTKKIEYIKEVFIKEIFLLNDPDEYFKYHKEAIKLKNPKEFRFINRAFTINADDTIEEKKSVSRDNVWVTTGCYWGYDQRGTPKQFSNFTMNVLFLLRSSTNPKRIVEFKNVLGQACVKELTMDDFVSVSSFRKKLIADGSFIFKGEMWELLSLQEILFKEEKSASELTSLGWHKNQGFWAWSNGLTANGKYYPVDEYGIVQYNAERYYLPAYSNLFTDADEIFKNERNFKHIDNEVTFEHWSHLFYKTYKDNGIVGLCFGIAV